MTASKSIQIDTINIGEYSIIATDNGASAALVHNGIIDDCAIFGIDDINARSHNGPFVRQIRSWLLRIAQEEMTKGASEERLDAIMTADFGLSL
jgi:ethanolamine utilization microcompartment shell protein EutS